jgi:hypothetical protein
MPAGINFTPLIAVALCEGLSVRDLDKFDGHMGKWVIWSSRHWDFPIIEAKHQKPMGPKFETTNSVFRLVGRACRGDLMILSFRAKKGAASHRVYQGKAALMTIAH